MAPGDIVQIFIVIILLLLSAFFSSAETALTTVNRVRMRTLADDGNKKAQRVLDITDNKAKMLSAILIGNNVVNLSASSLLTTLATNLFGSQWIALSTGVLTFLILIFGEISPKTFSTFKAEKISLAYSGIISGLMWILTPVIFIVNKFAMGFLLLLGVDSREKGQSFTEDELRTIVDVSHEEGVLEHEEHEMINNVFDFGNSRARDVMIQRIDMTCASIDSTYDEIIDIFRAEKYTRLPIYKDSIDNVIGIINVKDLLLYSPGDDFHVSEILREPYYTYEFKKTSELMEELKKINRILEKEYPDAYRETLVVLDATTGQNALNQAREFSECADITGIILTKMDGTAKGGIAVAIQSELGIPVKYVGIGEKIDDLQKFDANDFVNALFKRNEALTENE